MRDVTDIENCWLQRSSEGPAAERLRELLSAGRLAPGEDSLLAYDLELLQRRFQRLEQGFPPGTLHAVAVKAAPLPGLLRRLVEWGAGLEVASSGERAVARSAGCPAGRTVFDSPCKTEPEIREAVGIGGVLNANSLGELERLDRLYREGALPTGARVGLRVNPLLEGRTESPTMVAHPASKFGLPLPQVAEAVRARPYLNGLHLHVGSQVATLEDLLESARAVYSVARELPTIGWLDIGGGLPTRYRASDPGLDPGVYYRQLQRALPGLGKDYPLITELGRSLLANCAWAATRVEYAENGRAVLHLGADFALRECYRPDDWWHRIEVYDAHGQAVDRGEEPVDLYGPLCFSGDCWARGRVLPKLQSGDIMVIHDVGAYTFGMWSRYCSRPMPAVLGRSGEGVWETLRRRETPEEVAAFWALDGVPNGPETGPQG